MAALFHIPNTRRTYVIYTIFMLLIAVFTFENVRTHDFWDGWDDRQLIEDARQANDNIAYMFSPEREMPIRPTADFVFLIGYMIWGDSPIAFRLLLIFMHFAASLMVVYTFRKMGIDLELCLISGLFFLVNVAHFRAVHWPTCINYVLGLMFALLVVIIFVSQVKKPISIWQILASLALLCGTFAHPGMIVVVPFCAYWAYRETQSIKQTISKIGFLFIAAFISLTLAIWVSPQANQATMLRASHDFVTLVQNFFWYLGRLFTSAFWLTQTTSSYTKPMSEIIFGVVVSVFFFFVHRRNSQPIAAWAVWIILFILVFINSEAYRLAFGPSRHLYMASVGSSLLLTWAIREIIRQTCPSPVARRTIFTVTIAIMSLSSIFFLRKAEALAIYFAGRGHAYRVIEDQGNLQKAARLFERAIRHAPHLVPDDIYIRLASMSFAMGEPGTDIFEGAGKRYPDNQTIAILQGVAMFLQPQEKQWQTGETKIVQALEQASDPDDLKSDAALAFHNIGGYYLRQRDYDKAARLFQKAIQYNPHHLTAYNNLGIALNELGKIEESLAAFRQGLVQRPNDVPLLQNFAKTLFAKGDIHTALPLFQKLAGIDSTNSDIQFNIGMAFMAMGDFQQAENALRSALRLNPSDAEALQKLAEIQYAQQKLLDAIESYQLLLNLQPNNALVSYNLGVLMLQNNRVSESIAILQRALQIHPQDIELHLALAEAYKSQGKPENAATLYQRILSINPNHSDAAEKLNALTP